MKIVLFNGKEIELTPEEAEMVKEQLKMGAEFIEIGDELIKAKEIKGVFKSEGLIVPNPDLKKLPEPKWHSTGELLKEEMKKLFEELKAKRLFKEYASYEEWGKAKYKE